MKSCLTLRLSTPRLVEEELKEEIEEERQSRPNIEVRGEDLSAVRKETVDTGRLLVELEGEWPRIRGGLRANEKGRVMFPASVWYRIISSLVALGLIMALLGITIDGPICVLEKSFAADPMETLVFYVRHWAVNEDANPIQT